MHELNEEWLKTFLSLIALFKEEMAKLGVQIKVTLELHIQAVKLPEFPPKPPIHITDLWGITTLSEAIVKLLSSEWGKNGRTHSELMHVFEALGRKIPKTTMSGVLNYLWRKGIITRERSFIYNRTQYIYKIAKGEQKDE